MTTRNDLLEHAVELFPVPDQALEQLHGRHHRRQQNRRLGAGALGLVIAIAIMAAALHLSRAAKQEPAEPTPRAMATFELPSTNTMSIAAGHGTLWALDYHEALLYKIDPLSGALVDTLRVNNDEVINGLPEGIQMTDSGLWVYVWQGGRFDGLEWVEPTTDRFLGFVRPQGAFLGEINGSVWLATRDAPARRGPYDRIARVDPSTGSMGPAGRFEIPSLTGLIASDGALWARRSDQIVRIDPEDGHLSVVATIRHPYDQLVAEAGSLWLVGGCRERCPNDPMFWKVDTTTGKETAIPIGPLPPVVLSNGDSVVPNRGLRMLSTDADAMWVMLSDAKDHVGRIVRLEYATGRLTYSDQVVVRGDTTSDARYLWMDQHRGDRKTPLLTRIDSTFFHPVPPAR